MVMQGPRPPNPVVPPSLGILANSEKRAWSIAQEVAGDQGGVGVSVCLFCSHSIGQNSVTWSCPVASSTRGDLYLDSLQVGEVGSSEHVAISAPGLLL